MTAKGTPTRLHRRLRIHLLQTRENGCRASGTAGPAISYGLGQGATMIAVLWGVFIWKEFKSAPAGTNKLLGLMFLFYMVGLALLIVARIV